MTHREINLQVFKNGLRPNGARRCTHCGGPMHFDPRDTCWVCLMCARCEPARSAN